MIKLIWVPELRVANALFFEKNFLLHLGDKVDEFYDMAGIIGIVEILYTLRESI